MIVKMDMKECFFCDIPYISNYFQLPCAIHKTSKESKTRRERFQTHE